MEIYIDSANLEEIREAISWGIVAGITTNPSLIKKEVDAKNAPDLDDLIREILSAAGAKPVSLEVTGVIYEEMVREGRAIKKRYGDRGNVVVKIPVNPSLGTEDKTQYDGLKTIHTLAKEGIAINTTLVMSPEQALLAARAGTAYVSPFAGRIDDYLSENFTDKKGNKQDYYPQEGKVNSTGKKIEDNGIVSGVDLVRSIVEIFRNYNLLTKVLAASVRNARQLREMALVGADIATAPFYVLDAAIRHKKTYEGAQHFKRDVVTEYAELLR